MSWNHRTPGIVRGLCTDSYHHDSREFAERGFHYLSTLKLVHDSTRPDGGPGPWFRIMWRGPMSRAPVKDFRRPDGLWVFRFDCSCGLDPQELETRLVKRAMQHWAANPGTTRFDLDITTI